MASYRNKETFVRDAAELGLTILPAATGEGPQGIRIQGLVAEERGEPRLKVGQVFAHDIKIHFPDATKGFAYGLHPVDAPDSSGDIFVGKLHVDDIRQCHSVLQSIESSGDEETKYEIRGIVLAQSAG
ncbi:hypothetical protein CCAX7_15610 [Capsulimonas corticalis]|uniref:Uncharacterized protein n=1 Tax=Capsulimonas corticalis TaxID=2219043 RepID=A0A402CZ48_9BACT|nr:hypothetical protein [Capsulimonas corticalis]BDI29510.1 hypothetical protein CCAX7_15610 [Capsulimonas corticalis]